MPIVYDQEEEQGGEQGQQQTQPQSGGMISGTGSSGVISGQPSSSGSYTNLRSYLDANRGAGKQMAEGIASDVGGQAQKAGEQMQGVQSQFQQNVQAGGQSYGAPQQQMVQQVADDPTKVDVGQFSQLREAAYSGPQQWGGQQQEQAAELQKKMENLRQASEGSQTGAGQRALLQQTYGRPSYSAGEQGLDQLLVQAPGAGREAFAGLRDTIGGLTPQYDQMKEQGLEQVAARKAETEAARNAALGAVGGFDTISQQGSGAIGDLLSQFYGEEGKIAQAQTQREQQKADVLAGAEGEFGEARKRKEFDAFKDAVLRSRISREITKKYGSRRLPTAEERRAIENQVTPGVIAAFDSGNYSALPQYQDYLSGGMGEANLQNVASAEDYAKMNALSQLGGIDNTLLYDPSLAGTYMQDPYTFNKDLYQDRYLTALQALAPDVKYGEPTAVSGRPTGSSGTVPVSKRVY